MIARRLTATGAALVVLSLVFWVVQQLQVIRSEHRSMIQLLVAAVIILVSSVLIWWVINKPSVVDFLIATEAEMRKVNWPTRRELIGSTWVVVIGTLLMAMAVFGVDLIFSAVKIWLKS